MSYLHTDGRWIKDADGKVVTFRGVNAFIRLQNVQAKFAAIKAMGANIVRLMLWKQDIENPGSDADPDWDLSGLAAIDRAVGWCRDLGLMVIFDQQAWSLNVAPGPPTFWTDPVVLETWLAMWRTLVNRYKDDPMVIGVDLMNEPYAIANPAVPDRQGAWEAIVKNAVMELRPLNPNLLFVVAGWGQRTVPGFRDIAFLQQANVVYTDHIYYASPESYHTWGQAYNIGDTLNGEALLSAYAHNKWFYFTDLGIPVFIGEIGFDPAILYWHEQMEDELNILDGGSLSYALFVVGTQRWGLAYDIMDEAYNLTEVGIEYSDYIKSWEEPMAITKPVSFTLVVTAVPDFFPAITPLSLSVAKGVVAVYQVSFTAQGGFAGPVSLAVINLPAGAVGTFDKPSITLGEALTLSIMTSGVAVGSYSPSIEATANL